MYVVLVVATEGVPLIVHVLLSIFKPVGSAGETVHVAPVTLAMMPPLEPLLAVIEESMLLPTKMGTI